MSDTSVFAAPTLSDPETDTERGWSVILYNDDIHDFLTVIFALQRAAGLSLEVAEMVAHEAHTEGRSIVKSGLIKDDALIICAGLRQWTRIEGHTSGVACEAIREEA